MMHSKNIQRLTALLISLTIGFALYFIMTLPVKLYFPALSYENIISGILSSPMRRLAWFLMNFTEAQFYAGIFSGLALIAGAAAAWLKARSSRQEPGISICGDYRLWPWVLASQLISLSLSFFVFGGLAPFSRPGVSWVASFIPLVGAPPAVILLCGPGIRQLLIGSFLGGLLCAPTANFLSGYLTGVMGLPSVVSSVLAMAITGAVICPICTALCGYGPASPKPGVSHNLGTAWRIKRVFADFTEAQFYGSSMASVFMLSGLLLEWVLCSAHGSYGSGLTAAVVLSQFVGSSVGVFLYGEYYLKYGWYPTFIPVVSVGPACVLAFGGGIEVAVFAGTLGGVFGGPIAQFLSCLLPRCIHRTVANVLSMAFCTTAIFGVMKALPWF